MEKQLRRSAARGHHIVLGTAEQPYEPLILGGAPLIALRGFEDLELTITTRSPEIGEQTGLLAELDQRHAVTVDVLIAACDVEGSDLREQLRAASALAAEGLTTRLLVCEPAAITEGEVPRRVEAGVPRLFESARQHLVYDVLPRGGTEVWRRLVERLRLEYGFPRRLPGRG